MATQGTTTIDFGAWPGSTHATVTVTGQTGILAGSLVEAWLFPTATAAHSSDEHVIATSMLAVVASDILAGTGFTIHLMARHMGGEALQQPSTNDTGLASTTVGQNAKPPQGLGVSVGGNDLNQHYGTYTVAWVWN